MYNAEISAGSLMLTESRRIARLLAEGLTEEEWRHVLKTDNILQKKTPATARRQARLIRNRLATLDPEAWKMIAEGEREVAIQLLLAAAIKHSRLLADFLRDVYGQRLRRLEKTLSIHSWQDFLIECAHRDKQTEGWSDSTKAKLFQVILRILAEAKYLDSTRRMGLTPPIIHPDVSAYLKRHGETQVLACMERRR